MNKKAKSFLIVFNSVTLIFIASYILYVDFQIRSSIRRFEEIIVSSEYLGEMLQKMKSSPSVSLVNHFLPSLGLKEKIENLNKIFP